MRWVWLVLIAAALGLAGFLYTRFESEAPEIEVSQTPVWVGKDYRHVIEVRDEGLGIEHVRVWLDDGEQTWELTSETYPGSLVSGAQLREPRRFEVTIDPRELGLPDGDITLWVEARDFSWRGNVSQASSPLMVDTRAPRVRLETGLSYLVRGGAEMVVYSVDEEVERHGVELGDEFFSGFPHPRDPTRFVALYALGVRSASDVKPTVLAEDQAGNISRVGAAVRVLEKGFLRDTIRLDDGFMERKVAEIVGASDDPLPEAYLKINRDMRAANAARLREICSDSNDEILWRGAFLQLPNSTAHAEAGYGVHRTYVYAGSEVDQQTHLGLDLASTSRAPVPAANDGIVVFADDLGIYGNTVVLDHGLGLFSLYAHLSEIGVELRAIVSQGDVLGRTGETGLAGGDHLHFSMLIQGAFTNPLEWLDGKWIEDHISAKLEVAEEPAAG